MEILAVNRSMKSASRNQFLRTPWAKEGDVYYLYKEKHRYKTIYQLSKRKRRGASEVTVKRQKHGGFLFIKTYGLVDEEGIFITYKEDRRNVVNFRLATKEESGNAQRWERRKPGYVYAVPAGNLLLTVPKEVRNVLKIQGTFRVQMHGGERPYLEYTAIEEDQYNPNRSLWEVGSKFSIPFEDFRQAQYYEWHFKKLKSHTSAVPLPTDFVRRTKSLEEGKSLFSYPNGKGGFIIESDPMICKCCGKPISRFADNAYSLKIHEGCKGLTSQKADSETLTELARQLKECRELLMELI